MVTDNFTRDVYYKQNTSKNSARSKNGRHEGMEHT